MPNYKMKPTLNGEGGGSSTYTAGNGINITDDNTINADVKVLVVEDIKTLTSEQCEILNIGDSIKVDGRTYYVTQKEEDSLYLTFIGSGYIDTILYVKLNDTWEFYSDTPRDVDGGLSLIGVDMEGGQVENADYMKVLNCQAVFTLYNETTDSDMILIQNGGNAELNQVIFSSLLQNGKYYNVIFEDDGSDSPKTYTVTEKSVGGGGGGSNYPQYIPAYALAGTHLFEDKANHLYFYKFNINNFIEFLENKGVNLDEQIIEGKPTAFIVLPTTVHYKNINNGNTREWQLANDIIWDKTSMSAMYQIISFNSYSGNQGYLGAIANLTINEVSDVTSHNDNTPRKLLNMMNGNISGGYCYRDIFEIDVTHPDICNAILYEHNGQHDVIIIDDVQTFINNCFDYDEAS